MYKCTIWFNYTISYVYLCLAQQKLDINENEPIKVVLESDGTEIDEEDYFETLEMNTLIMILKSDQKWGPYNLRYTKLLMFLFYLHCLSGGIWILYNTVNNITTSWNWVDKRLFKQVAGTVISSLYSVQ